MDPISTTIERLDAWRAEASARARDAEANRAAHWIYASTLALDSAHALRRAFAAQLDEIEVLEPESLPERGPPVASQARALATSERLVGRLFECSGVLRAAAEDRPGWLASVVRSFGAQRRQQEVEEAVSNLAELADDVLRWIGAREKAPTPSGITDVEVAILTAHDEASLATAKARSREALNVINPYELREAHGVLGELRDKVASTYGLPPAPSVDIR